MNPVKVPRFFIQTDPTHPHANIARWVELSLTDAFFARVQEMHRLFVQHSLELVTAEFNAKWCLFDGWEVHPLGGQGTQLEVWSNGFTVAAQCVRAGKSNVPRAQTYRIEASYIWGDIDEFISHYYPDGASEPYDHLETAQDILGCSSWEETNWDIAFAHELKWHLVETGERPLYFHDDLMQLLFAETATASAGKG